MHPILRIFVYQTHGSLCFPGSIEPYAQGGHGREQSKICNTMPLEPVDCDGSSTATCFRVITIDYQTLPRSLPGLLKHLVDLV